MKRKAPSTDGQPNSKKFKADQAETGFNTLYSARKTTEEIYFDLARLPPEILGDFIFKYFSFEYWLQSLILVNKQWYHAAIQSSVEKQLLVNTDIPLHLFNYYAIASRFNITTIALTGTPLLKGQLSALFSSSSRLRTFVQLQLSPSYNAANFSNMKFENIKTACIFSDMIDLFPNATKVQFLDLKLKWIPSKKYPNVVELAVHAPGSVSGLLKSFPSLQVFHCSVPVQSEVPKPIEFRFSYIANRNWSKYYSYDQVWAGEVFKSPLFHAIAQPESTPDEIKELAKHTSLQYEIDLQDRINEYKFPAVTRKQIATWRPKKISLSDAAARLLKTHASKASSYYQYFAIIDGLNMLLESNDKELLEDFVVTHAEEISQNMRPAIMEKLAIEFEITTLQRIFTKEQLQRMISCKDKTGNIVHHLMETDDPDLLEEYIQEFGPLADDWLQCPGLLDLTPIEFALDLSSYKWVEYLVKAGAKIDGETLFGEEDEVKEIKTGFLQKTIRLIWPDSCTNPDINWFFDLQWTNLETEEKIEMFEFFIDLLDIKDINTIEQKDLSKDEGGRSLFNHMIQGWDADIDFLEYVVKRVKVDLNHADFNDMTPLLTAIEEQNHELMVWLLEHGATATPSKGFQPLYELLRERSTPPITVLTFIDTLLFYGADINAYTDEEGRLVTPLHTALSYGQPLEVIKYLVARGARPEMTDSEGGTVLHLAMLSMNPQVIKYLAALVDINKPDYHGVAPIHNVLCSPRYISLLSAYVDSGADCNLAQSDFKMTPLMIACLKSNFEAAQELLKQKKINIQAVDVHGHSFVYYLVKYFEGYSVFIFKGWFTENASHLLTPENTQFVINETKKVIEMAKQDAQISFNLFKLASSYLFLAEFLIEQVRFDINTQDSNGDVLLSYPMHRGEVQSYLLKQHPNVNIQNKDGNTPLMLALQRNEVHWFCKEMVDLGADLTLKNKWGISVSSIIPDPATHFKEKEPNNYFEERFKKENGLT